MNTLFTPDGKTDAHTVIAVMKFFKDHPEGQVKTGIWKEKETWNYQEFKKWFYGCLLEKINSHNIVLGRKTSPVYQEDLWTDARIINDYFGKRIRNSGRNILRTPEMKMRYPEIDNPPFELY
jgi:hypothetical protein